MLATILAILAKLLPMNIGDYIFDIFALVIVVVCGFEISEMLEKSGKQNNRFFATMYGVFNYFISLIVLKNQNLGVLVLAQIAGLVIYFVIVAIYLAVKEKQPSDQVFKMAFNTILCCVYPSFWFCFIVVINHIDYLAGVQYFSLIFIILIFAVTMLTDTFAYLIGSKIRGPKLAPSISPNKTISGAVGGLLGGIVGAMLVLGLAKVVPDLNSSLVMYSLSWWQFLIMGFILSVFGQAGDLFESKLKRIAGVKDSGTIFPGHGGMMDRVDAMTFVVAVTFVWIFIFMI